MEFKIIKADLDYTIYKHIASLAAFRGEEIVGNGFDGKDGSYPLSETLFATKRDNTKYVVVKSKNITFLQLCRTGDYHKKAKLGSLLGKISTEKVIIIKHEKFNIKEIDFNGEYEIIDGDRYLLFDWAEVQSMKGGKAKPVSPEDWKNNLINKNFLVEVEDLPGIGVSSHEAVLNGCKPNDIIECTYPALSSNGTTASYRRVNIERSD